MLVVVDAVFDVGDFQVAAKTDFVPCAGAVGAAIGPAFGSPPEEVAEELGGFLFQGGAGEVKEEVWIPAA